MIDIDETRFVGALSGKKVVLAVTASISIYRIPDLIRDLRREGAAVTVGMSREAASMINPNIMKWASEQEVVTEITGYIEHISCFDGDPHDTLLMVCPASYNFIGKASSGISDDVPSLFFSFALGNGNPVLIAPVMHEGMMVNPINQANLQKLEGAGVAIVPPKMHSDKAKISETEKLVDYAARSLNRHILMGRRAMIIGGKGEEKIDPVRTITNSGTGTTAFWLVRSAFRMGAERIVFIGNSQQAFPDYVEYHPASTMDQYEKHTVEGFSGDSFDFVINSASLPDYKLEKSFKEKLDSSGPVELKLVTGKKLNSEIRKHHKGVLVVFKLSREKEPQEIRIGFREVEPDIIVFNPFTDEKLPFGSVSNEYTFITESDAIRAGKLYKPKLAWNLLMEVSKILRNDKT